MAIGFPVKDDYVTGDVLTAANMNDLSGTLNTIQSVEYAAGKNKIINGDFTINQRAFTSTTTSATYTFDRFVTSAVDGTSTFTAQTFTLGAAPVAGYEGKNFISVASTGQTLTSALTFLSQKIESVRTFAGQTVTVSFWAKAASGTPKVAVELSQNFGSGGSPSASVNIYAGSVTLTTSFVRYSVSVAMPSISGKTLGTANDDIIRLNLWTSAGSDFNTRTGSLGIQTTTISFWGVQLEAATTASDFQTATGTLQGELAACQRYFQLVGSGGESSGGFYLTTAAVLSTSFPVQMRVSPTTTFNATFTNAVDQVGTALRTPTGYSAAYASVKGISILATGMSSATVGNPAVYIGGNHQMSAEL